MADSVTIQSPVRWVDHRVLEPSPIRWLPGRLWITDDSSCSGPSRLCHAVAMRNALFSETTIRHDQYPFPSVVGVHPLATNERLHPLLSVLPPKKLSWHRKNVPNVLE